VSSRRGLPELVALARRLGVVDASAGMGFPWCAFAAFLAALACGGRTAAIGLRHSAFNPLYVPDVYDAAKAGLFGLSVVEASGAARGDLVLFDWPGGDPVDHVGRLRHPIAAGVVSTVDGNAGDGVTLRERPLTAVRAIVRDS
jgi:hypothetical protein